MYYSVFGSTLTYGAEYKVRNQREKNVTEITRSEFLEQRVLLDNSAGSLIVCHTSICTINFTCFLPYSFPVLHDTE
jgi:hypothetical protein